MFARVLFIRMIGKNKRMIKKYLLKNIKYFFVVTNKNSNSCSFFGKYMTFLCAICIKNAVLIEI